MSNAPRDFLKTNAKEGMKMYITYDGTNRMEYVYEAQASARDGDPCLRTQYVYAALTTRIVKMAETQSTWVSATMDI